AERSGIPMALEPKGSYRHSLLLLGLSFVLVLAGVWPASASIGSAAAAPGAAISARDRVYTADQVSNTITVIDPSTNTVLGTLPLGDARLDSVFSPLYFRETNTHGLGFSADARTVAPSNLHTNPPVVINAADNSVQATYY